MDSIAIGQAPQPPMRRWRCTKGHKWTSRFAEYAASFAVNPDLGVHLLVLLSRVIPRSLRDDQ
jgi:hypothetical protein